MLNRILAENGQKNKNVIVVMSTCLLFLTFALLPNNSLAFSSATANFDAIGMFDVLGFGENGSLPDNGSSSGGRAASRADLGIVYIQISLNNQIPLLFVSCANGSHIKEVTITFDEGLYSIKLSNVVVSSFDWSELKEQNNGLGIGLSYGKIEWTYDGITAGWDLEANRAVVY